RRPAGPASRRRLVPAARSTSNPFTGTAGERYHTTSSTTKLVEKAMNSTPAVTTKAPKQAKKTVNVQQKQGKVKTYKIDPNKRLTSGIVDQILLIDSLKPVREGLVDTLKTQMLSTESKYADG